MTEQTTRRAILKLAGGGLALVVGAGAGWRPIVAANDATPAASPVAADSLLGQQVVIRLRTLKAETDAADVLAQIQEGFVPLVETIPGAVWYVVAANPDTHDLFSIGVYADAAGAEASGTAAQEWVAAHIPDVYEGDATSFTGEIGVATAAPAGDLHGKHIVVRLRQANPEWPVADVMHTINEGYVPLVEQLDGFVAYFGGADPASGEQAYVTVFDDAAGTAESTKVAGDWLKAHDYTFFTGDPVVTEGEIGAALATPA
ncbi:MAG: hypothetical protein QM692_19000 [Thermomicrobiales bacterium]